MREYFILATFFLQALLCSAQVPVSKEPRHHNVFENAFVRVLDVHVPPNDTSQFHKHETPSVFIVLASAKTGSEVIMEDKRNRSFEGRYYILLRVLYKTAYSSCLECRHYRISCNGC